jgi:L-ribulose-5-phosphate 4-epimerase
VTEHLELRERALAANLALVAADLITLTFGNASAADRDAGVMAIKPSGVEYDALTPQSMVVLDIETGARVDGAHRPSSDTPTHLLLYRRMASIGGIVHTHSPFATAWSQAGLDLPCFGTTHADHFDGPVPVTRHLTALEIAGDYEEQTGEVIVETILGRGLDPLHMPAVLVRGHAPFTWGATAAAAVVNAIALEAVAALAQRTLALAPDAPPIPDELLRRHHDRKHGPGAYYGQP